MSAQVASGEQNARSEDTPQTADAASLQKKASEAQARIRANKDDRDQLMRAIKINEVPLAKEVLLRNGFTAEDLENAKITLRTGGGKGGEDELEISATCCDPKRNHNSTITGVLHEIATTDLKIFESGIRNPPSRKALNLEARSPHFSCLPAFLINLNQEMRNPCSRKRNASCVSNLIFSGPNVSRDGNGDGIGRVRFSGYAEKHCASS